MINLLQQQASLSVHDLNLIVEQDGMKITIKSGKFRIQGQDYELLEDFVHNVEERNFDSKIRSYLVLDKSNNVQIIVDERYLDLNFISPKNIEGYTYLSWLYRISYIPKKTKTLDNVEILVRNFISNKGE